MEKPMNPRPCFEGFVPTAAFERLSGVDPDFR